MTTSPVRVERRVGQRFSYLLPVSISHSSRGIDGVGFTQDLSSKGVFFFTDAPLVEGAEVELTLRMPSEITLGESMPVRCRGRVLRVSRPNPDRDSSGPAVETKIGVAVRLEGYEYLTTDSLTSLLRASSVHSCHEEGHSLAHSSTRP